AKASVELTDLKPALLQRELQLSHRLATRAARQSGRVIEVDGVGLALWLARHRARAGWLLDRIEIDAGLQFLGGKIELEMHCILAIFPVAAPFEDSLSIRGLDGEHVVDHLRGHVGVGDAELDLLTTLELRRFTG